MALYGCRNCLCLLPLLYTLSVFFNHYLLVGSQAGLGQDMGWFLCLLTASPPACLLLPAPLPAARHCACAPTRLLFLHCPFCLAPYPPPRTCCCCCSALLPFPASLHNCHNILVFPAYLPIATALFSFHNHLGGFPPHLPPLLRWVGYHHLGGNMPGVPLKWHAAYFCTAAYCCCTHCCCWISLLPLPLLCLPSLLCLHLALRHNTFYILLHISFGLYAYVTSFRFICNTLPTPRV